MFWKRHDGSESNPVVADSGDHNIAMVAGFRGCATTGDPWDQKITTADAVSNTGFSAQGFTTTVPECLIVVAGCVATDIGTARFGSWANASLTSVTERFDQASIVGNGGGIGMATGIKATAGVVNATTATLVTASFNTSITLALKPPAAGEQHSGTASLSGGGSVAGVGRKGALRTAAVTGGGAATATARKGALRAVALSGGGMLTVVGTGPVIGGSVSLSGGGTLTANGRKGALGTVLLSGAGALVVVSGPGGEPGHGHRKLKCIPKQPHLPRIPDIF
jgi:hypothetical protein